jgi:sarcosine oxidase
VERVDVAIVGGGPMGLAAARALGSRGRSAIVFERFRVGHANGSTAGTTRNFRLTYHDPLYVRMARLALEAWRALEDEAGLELLRTVGGLDVGDATDTAAEALRSAGEAFERPGADDVAARWPTLRFAPDARFLWQADGAIIRSRDAVAALARLAIGHGADVREGTAVRLIRPAGDAVEVVTDHDEVVRAPAAIVAAGAWTPALVRGCGVEVALQPTLEQSTYVEIDAHRLPTVIDWAASLDEPPYLVPDPFEPGLVKAGIHRSGPPVDPDARSFEPDPVREERTMSWLRGILSTRAALRGTETCLYTIAPDDDFVLDRVGPVVVASPCSGHGFKFTPLVGEILADLATGAAPTAPLDRFRLGRRALRPRAPA